MLLQVLLVDVHLWIEDVRKVHLVEQTVVDVELVEPPDTSTFSLEERPKDKLTAVFLAHLGKGQSNRQLVVGLNLLRAPIVFPDEDVHVVPIEAEVIDAHQLVFVRGTEQVTKQKGLVLVDFVLILIEVGTVEVKQTVT